MNAPDRDLDLAAALSERRPTVLCVDDEASILSALRRMFRAAGYHILTAERGAAALEILDAQQVDLVISDMRMPEMDGAQLLATVRERCPDTVRILLTGYADVQSVMDAVNRGEIYRYVTKPWDDNDILLAVRDALERKFLQEEKRRLEALTRSQNERLLSLNANLEEIVATRTQELRLARDELAVFNDKLRASFLTSIKMLSGMVEMRAERLAGHSRRVAELARRIARHMQLSPAEIQEVFIAGLLHGIGKVSLPDELLSIPVSMMNGDKLGLYRKYPVRGEELLIPLDELRGAAALVRSHTERFDGEGFPDGLSGFDIPLGARILAVASDYDNLQIGALSQRSFRPAEALTAVVMNRGKRYDPAVVAVLQELMAGRPDRDIPASDPLSVPELRPGMVIARDLISKDGFLLLSADHRITDRLIRQLADFESASGTQLTIYIRSQREKS